MRIGELSRRTGVRAETIRAWERRYDLVEPARSAGGFRLYSPGDEERVRVMRSLIAAGVAAAEAARQARSGAGLADGALSSRSPDGEAARLLAALETYDEEGANAVLDRALGGFSLDVFTGAVVLPAMAAIGAGWARGEVSVAQEHFATCIVRGRLLALSRGWGSGLGPLAVLACPPGELHDIGLIACGLSLRNRGWRIAYLGPDTPLDTLAEAARDLSPTLVVMSVTTPELLAAAGRGLRDVAASVRVYVGGAGADEEVAREAHAQALTGRPNEAAARLTMDAAGQGV